MAFDSPNFNWSCRACGNTFKKREQAISHVNNKQDGKHRGQQPYKMVAPDIDSEDECVEDKIVQAFKEIRNGDVEGYGPTITYNEIKYVSNAADVPKGHCCRVLDDSGIEYTCSGRPPIRYIDETGGKTHKVLRYMKDHDTSGMTNNGIAETIGVNRQDVNNAVSRYGWLLDYDYNESITDYNGDVETTGVEDALSELEEEVDKTEDKGNDGAIRFDNDVPEVKVNTIDLSNSYAELEDERSESVVEYTLDEDEVFEYIKLLILNEQEDKARDVFDKLV